MGTPSSFRKTPSVRTVCDSEHATIQEIVLKKLTEHHIRVAVVGNVDAGKSTLIGCLVTSSLDDGRGVARSKIVKHRHELVTGKTSTIQTYLLGLDENDEGVGILPENEMVLKSHRLVSLMDLAGHQKYLKTTIAGIARGMADYALVLVNAAQTPAHMTRQHLSLCVGAGIPVIVVLTKTDHCPDHVFQSTKKEVASILKSPDVQKRPFLVKNERDIDTLKDKVSLSSPWTPVIPVSAVTGEGLHVLRQLLARLPPRRCHALKHRHKPFEYQVEKVFNVPGVGTVLSGFVNRGEWKKGESLYIGPLKDGTILKTVPKSAHVAKTAVDRAWAGHPVCFSIPKQSRYKRNLFGRGMFALKEPFVPVSRFVADVYWTKSCNAVSGVTIRCNQFEATLNILHNKQTVKILDIQVDGEPMQTIRQGARADVIFEFKHERCYVRPGMKIILRDGHVLGYGTVRAVLMGGL